MLGSSVAAGERAPAGRRRRPRFSVSRALVVALLIAWAIVETVPILFMFNTSLKLDADILANPFAPALPPNVDNYLQVWAGEQTGQPFLGYLLNSATILLGTLASAADRRLDGRLRARPRPLPGQPARPAGHPAGPGGAGAYPAHPALLPARRHGPAQQRAGHDPRLHDARPAALGRARARLLHRAFPSSSRNRR